MSGGGARWRLARRVPPIIWACTAAFTLTLAAYSVLIPLFEAPDEPSHVDLVILLADGGSYPRYDERIVAAGVTNGCAPFVASIIQCPGDTPREAIPHPRFIVEHAARDAPAKDALPTYEELGGGAALSPPNQLVQHPPLYYELMGGALRAARFVLPGELSLAQEVALLRAFNVLMVAPLPVLTWAAARRLGLAERAARAAALLTLVVPQLTHIGSAVNNDNLLILFGAVATLLAASVLRGDRRWGTALALAATVGAAMLTKTSAVGLVALAVAAYAVSWWRAGGAWSRGERRAVMARAGVAVLGMAVIAGWWYLRNRLNEGTFVPSIASEWLAEREPPPGFTPDVGAWTEIFAAHFPARFWGWFGWFSVRSTFRVLVGASVATVALLAIGVAAPRTHSTPDGRRPRRLDLAALLVSGFVMLGMVVGRGWLLYADSGSTPFLQGRYLFPALGAGAIVAACGMDRLVGRWASPAVLLWAAVMHADALRAILRAYWAGEGDGLLGRLRSAVAWSPWPGEVLGVGAVLGIAAGIALVVTVALELRSGPADAIDVAEG